MPNKQGRVGNQEVALSARTSQAHKQQVAAFAAARGWPSMRDFLLHAVEVAMTGEAVMGHPVVDATDRDRWWDRFDQTALRLETAILVLERVHFSGDPATASEQEKALREVRLAAQRIHQLLEPR
jgi:hypothetical protein